MFLHHDSAGDHNDAADRDIEMGASAIGTSTNIHHAAAAMGTRQRLRSRIGRRRETVSTAIHDPESELSRFIDADGPSINSQNAWFYSLALDAQPIRRDRIVQLAEAYCLFAALFLNGTWFIYEYGVAGSLSERRSDRDDYFYGVWGDRVFNCTISIAIISNIFMAMFSGFLWILSVLFSGSHRNWVYGARPLLHVCQVLITAVFLSTTVSSVLAVYSNLRGEIPELTISLLFLGVVVIGGMYKTSVVVAREVPLEYKHLPFLYKLIYMPWPLLTKNGREHVEKGAQERARELRVRASRERKEIDAHVTSINGTQSSIGVLLRKAANACGRDEYDIAPYCVKLERDWYNNVDELRSLDVSAMSVYMPRRLAEEVVRRLKEERDFNTAREQSRRSGSGGLKWNINVDGKNDGGDGGGDDGDVTST